jgi:hypothetical protein
VKLDQTGDTDTKSQLAADPRTNRPGSDTTARNPDADTHPTLSSRVKEAECWLTASLLGPNVLSPTLYLSGRACESLVET